jgi:predicted nucleic acid-binding protein
MRVLIDTNVVLDFLQDREPFSEDAAKLFEKIDAGEVEGFIAAITVTNIYYIVRKAAGLVAAQDLRRYAICSGIRFDIPNLKKN